MSSLTPILQQSSVVCAIDQALQARRHIAYQKVRKFYVLGTIAANDYFRASRITQAPIVEAGIADSSHRRFIIICLSRGASNLSIPYQRRSYGNPPEKNSTEKSRDMRTVFGIILSMYSAIVTAGMATMRAVYVLSHRSPSKHKAEQTAFDGERMKTNKLQFVTAT